MRSVWRGKILAHMVESTSLVWKDLGSSPVYVIFCVLLNLYYFVYIKTCCGFYNYWIVLVSMKYELVALVRH